MPDDFFPRVQTAGMSRSGLDDLNEIRRELVQPALKVVVLAGGRVGIVPKQHSWQVREQSRAQVLWRPGLALARPLFLHEPHQDIERVVGHVVAGGDSAEQLRPDRVQKDAVARKTRKELVRMTPVHGGDEEVVDAGAAVVAAAVVVV
eukprot:CAMPEP_0202071136 /NCGR_PEP_ID=MMETSP0964-20121228/1604_1 /ASSEMBLY_ACC=CAM_ASM_000500 /TAXON_ID=4773 /ORGANISM="Schizochytrium aggregatum, Strain ATCC28209" /LENGTH=147 /DNA_ID=CAMNT_0048638059 /DNA_START=68 /DNA_END=506 /DNA_ORIENTATION=+